MHPFSISLLPSHALESSEQGVHKPSKVKQSLIKLFIKTSSFVREALR